MHTIYTGERVRLRPFRDQEEWCGLWDELHTVPNDFWGAWWKPRSQLEKNFSTAGMLDPQKYSVFAIERLHSGELVGYEEHGEVEPGAINNWLGTFILPAHWHQGFGIEAKLLCLCYLFESYPLERVWSSTLKHHTRAARGLEACGMSFEGTVRGYHPDSGRFTDMVFFRVFREEWERMEYRHKVKRG